MMSTSPSVSTTSSWKTAIGEGVGSFRGVAFSVTGKQSQNGGRRTVRREFPLRENGGSDDLGKRLREYSFSAILIGDDYLSRRDKLIDALDAPGAGELIHPNWGTLQVQIDTWSCEEDTSGAGSASFNVSFTPPLDTTAPVSTADAEKAREASAAALTALNDDFASNWSLSDLSPSDIKGVIDNVTAKVNDITASIQSAFGVLDEFNDIMASATALQASVSALIYEPAALAHQVGSLVDGVAGVSSSMGGAFNAYTGMYSRLTDNANTAPVIESVDEVGEVQPQLVTKPDNPQTEAVVNQFNVMTAQTVAIYSAASASGALTESINYTRAQNRANAPRPAAVNVISGSASAETEETAEPLIKSTDDAITITQSIAVVLDNLTPQDSTLKWHRAEDYLRRLRIVFIEDMMVRSRLLPALTTITPTATQPALTLLNDIYGNTSDLTAFTRRNNIKNPLFLLPGTYYEVLKDGR